MFNRYLTYYSPALQFVIFCAIMSLSFLVGAYLAEILNEKFLGVSTVALESMKEISASLALKLKILNPILLIIILLLPALLFAYLAYPKPAVYLGLQAKSPTTTFLLAMVLLLVTMPLVSALEEWGQWIPIFKETANDRYDIIAKSMLKGSSIQDLLINTLSICIIPALAEEIFFRGCLQQILLNWLKKYPYIALIIVAVLFSAFHGQLSGFIPRVYLGFLLGLLYYYSGNLWVPILVHMLNNFVSVFLSFLKERGVIHYDIMDDASVNIFLAIGSLVLSLGIIMLLYKKRQIFQPVQVNKMDIELNNNQNQSKIDE